MKRLAKWIPILLVTLSSFSQTGTKVDSIVPLRPEIAKLVIKDLIQGDGWQAELTQLRVLLELNKRKDAVNQEVIVNLGSKVTNLQNVIGTKDRQFKIQEELSKELHKELRKQKRNTLLYKVGTGLGILTSVILITK